MLRGLIIDKERKTKSYDILLDELSSLPLSNEIPLITQSGERACFWDQSSTWVLEWLDVRYILWTVCLTFPLNTSTTDVWKNLSIYELYIVVSWFRNCLNHIQVYELSSDMLLICKQFNDQFSWTYIRDRGKISKEGGRYFFVLIVRVTS